jgi:protein-S-isoprenylcysteine O-methyltransferase Ste14
MSITLVALQFILLALIVYPSHTPAFSVLNIALLSTGLLVLLLALFAMRQRTFSVMPEPRQQGELITRGIYRLVRHPMYLAVLLCAVGASLAYQDNWKWGAFALLTFVLIVKLRREENLLLKRYPGYAAYREKVKGIVPFVW